MTTTKKNNKKKTVEKAAFKPRCKPSINLPSIKMVQALACLGPPMLARIAMEKDDEGNSVSVTKSPRALTNNLTDFGNEKLASFKDQKESQLTKVHSPNDQTSEVLRNHSECNNMECNQDEFPKETLQINGPSDQINGDKISHGNGSYTANIEKEEILFSAPGSGSDDGDHEESNENTAEKIITV